MKIYIKTTESCNLRCKHCYIGDNRSKKEMFNPNKVIQWIKDYTQKWKIKEEDLYFSFHGGEPFLADLNDMQKVCNAFPTATFDATTNLAMDIHHGIKNFILKNFQQKDIGPFLKTSWDYDIRFSTKAQESLWKRNVTELLESGVTLKVITCLTKPFIENISPQQYLDFMKDMNIYHTGFERLTFNTTEDKTLIPDIDKMDDWLLECYQKNDFLEQAFFSDIAAACNHCFIGCRKRKCMQNVLTINADGTIGGCPNSSIKNWFFTLDGIVNKDLRNRLIKNEQLRNPVCYACDLFQECNGDCHQLSWIDKKCYTPKRLFRQIKKDIQNHTGFISEDWL